MIIFNSYKGIEMKPKRQNHKWHRWVATIASALVVSSCLEKQETTVDTLRPDDGGVDIDVTQDDSQSDISKIGFITALTNFTNSSSSLVTATFIDIEQTISRPNPDEQNSNFVEKCVISDAPTGPIVPITSDIVVSSSGGISGGDALQIDTGGSAQTLMMEKLTTEDSILYTARLPLSREMVNSWTIEIPGDDFPATPEVIVPRNEAIKNFLPTPGSKVTKDTVFSWDSMSVAEGDDPAFMEIVIVNESSTLNCSVLDDGAFTISEGEFTTNHELFDSGIIAAVTRQTRHDTFVDNGHIIATNITSVMIDIPEDEREGIQIDPKYNPGDDTNVSVSPLPSSGFWAEKGFIKVLDKSPNEEHLGMTIEEWFRGPFSNGHPLFMFYDGDETDLPNRIENDPIDNTPAIPVKIPFEGLGARKYRGMGYRSNQFGSAGVGNGSKHVVFSVEMMTQDATNGGTQIPSNSGYGTYVGLGHFMITPGGNELIGAGTFNPDGSAIRFITKGSNSSDPARMAFYVYGIEDYEAGLRNATLGKGSTRYRSEANFNDYFYNRWSQVDVEIKLNSSSESSDGFLRAYINGELIAEHTSERLVGRADMSFRGWGQFYDQRFAQNPMGSTMWYRNYEIWFK